MKNNFLKIIKISRFRFWVYLWGSYILGYSLGVRYFGQFLDVKFLINIFYFSLPANLLIYSVNDISDKETDKFNSKKGSYEYKINNKDNKLIKLLIYFCLIISIFIIFFIDNNLVERIFFILFLFLSLGYSLKPFRFKAIPILDSLSNILYAIPGFLGFYQSGNQIVDLKVVLIALSWNAAMHLFSAIPDILPDKKANIKTSALLFGENGSLIICTILWMIFACSIIFTNFLGVLGLLCLIYPLITIYLLIRPKKEIIAVYKLFPYINIILGILAFVTIFFKIILK